MRGWWRGSELTYDRLRGSWPDPLIPNSLLIFSTIKLFFSSNFEKLNKEWGWILTLNLRRENNCINSPVYWEKIQSVCVTTTKSSENEKQKSESLGPGFFWCVKRVYPWRNFSLLSITSNPTKAPLLRDHTPSPIGASRGKHYYPPIHTFITPQSSWAVPVISYGDHQIKTTTSVILYKHNFAEVSIPIGRIKF